MADGAARWLITTGGLTIIASISAILLFILIEVYPLLRSPRIEELSSIPRISRGDGALVSDEYRSHVALLSHDGHLRVIATASGEVVETLNLGEEILDEGETLVQTYAPPGRDLLTGATSSGRVVAMPLRWDVSFLGSQRQVAAKIGSPILFDLETGEAPSVFAVRLDEDEAGTAVAATADGRLVLVRRTVEENLFSGEFTESFARSETELDFRPGSLLLDEVQSNLYGSLDGGDLAWWTLRAGKIETPQIFSSGSATITAMTLLIGDTALVLGREDGSLEVAFPVRQADESFRMEKIRSFEPLAASVQTLSPSPRDKGFLAQDDSGQLGLYHSTSGRRMWTSAAPRAESATALRFAPKADGAFLLESGRITHLTIDNPHPEISWSSLFGKIWYEGYSEARFTWQSSAGTDDFEPKLSLIPLMFGTLKGTLYSLFLAIPLGVLGAMYTSQFMDPRLRRYVKPSVEIMAALPSVVLGFLAGLWLAPRIERLFPGLILMAFVLPMLVIAVGLLWRGLPRSFRGHFPAGSETLLHVLVLIAGMWGCLRLNESFGLMFFGGSFQSWLLETTGLAYDQRNAVVVGLAMGFAVIPIIFSIAEDAFSNVPRNLISGSLALGASRWQTVTRVVLPTASPGIFSGIMIGFGRAVGETMIVLMATGNTPLMDWNAFNGFRTLSANIAVEIPEAPHGATLYRTLFLAALILFLFTFLINTVAELVRQRLRTRYAQL